MKINSKEVKMNQNYITKKCERCGAEIHAPKEYPGDDNFLRLIQITCPNNHKSHTYDYILDKWWR